jgi:hypothetical protein
VPGSEGTEYDFALRLFDVPSVLRYDLGNDDDPLDPPRTFRDRSEVYDYVSLFLSRFEPNKYLTREGVARPADSVSKDALFATSGE